MPTSLERLHQRFAALTLREQRMAVGTLVVLFWAGWDGFIHQPQSQESQRLSNDIGQVQKILASQRNVSAELEKNGNQDPNGQNRQNLKALQTAIANLNQQLNAGEKRFVPSQQMANALRDILKQHGNLQLIALETLAPKAFGNDPNQTWVYRHSLNLTVKGDYFSTLGYLKALENLPWRIHWEQIDYNVTDYPLAETRIQVYTLSFEQDWLGV